MRPLPKTCPACPTRNPKLAARPSILCAEHSKQFNQGKLIRCGSFSLQKRRARS